MSVCLSLSVSLSLSLSLSPLLFLPPSLPPSLPVSLSPLNLSVSPSISLPPIPPPSLPACRTVWVIGGACASYGPVIMCLFWSHSHLVRLRVRSHTAPTPPGCPGVSQYDGVDTFWPVQVILKRKLRVEATVASCKLSWVVHLGCMSPTPESQVKYLSHTMLTCNPRIFTSNQALEAVAFAITEQVRKQVL